MDLTTRGTSGKLVASGTRVGRMARLNLQAASILTRRGLCYPPSHGSKRVPDIRAGQWGRIFSPPQNPGSLVWRLTMPHFNIHPYEFFKNSDGNIVIRQQFMRSSPGAVVLTRGQMNVFIEHLQWFVDHFDGEDRRAEVENLLKEISDGRK